MPRSFLPLFLQLALRAMVLPVMLAGASAPAAADPAAASFAASIADSRFTALYTREWKWRQQQTAVDEDNTERVDSRLPDVTPAAQVAKLKYLLDVRAELDAIALESLSPVQRENYAVYRTQIDAFIDEQQFRDYEKPLNADTSFWGNLTYIARRPFKTEKEYRSFLAQMNDMPRYFSEQTENMRAGLARGFTPPKVSLLGRDASITSITSAKTPEDSLFYMPFREMPASIPPAVAAELRAAAVKTIAEKVLPAHEKLLVFMRDTYIPQARDALAAEALPDGKAYYQSKIRAFTTLNLTPDEIQAIGVTEVARIRAQMLAIMQEVKFGGDLASFLHFLRTDKQFYASSPEQLLKEATWISKQFDGKASTWFGHLPRMRFAVKPVPDDVAPFYTGGRGGPGIYLVNTWNLPARPLYSLRALTLHESAPGHAFQMPLAMENTKLPDFRRKTYLSVYGEGWALYCEKLGVEMGMYETPYDRFGMLSYQMWRAARLVVDTGIHAKGWTREKAQQFLHDNTALADHEIETEVDRYIAWPGQALSYYLGEMAIEKARAKAENSLGPKFDIRAFHDTVLDLGSVPIPVLEARGDRFIAEGGKGPYSDEEQ
jgi:uncharacterized protein (DUF885 family)